MGGDYVSRLLRVDLEREVTEVEEISGSRLRKFVGGPSLAADILWRETSAATEAFSPQNRLMFMVGPVSGCVPLSSRYAVCGLSPATEAWGEAFAGGVWPAELRKAGFSGIVFAGKASHPVYLWVKDGRAQLRDAGHLWGKDTYEVSELIRRETDARACVAAIGRAGENLVRLAGVISDGKLGRAAARNGLGAVLGAKNVKAVAVRGDGRPSVADDAKLKATNNVVLAKLRDIKSGKLWKMPTLDSVIPRYQEAGNLPVRNQSGVRFEPFVDMIKTSFRHGKPYYCSLCPISCIESHVNPDGSREIVGEALMPMGPNCLISDLKVLEEGYDLCNKYGMDTISVGSTVAFAMECFQEGIISREDTGGLELTWGNTHAFLEIIKQMGEAQGFGKVLGQGVKRAAEQIGGKAHLYALHVKGLEPALHDPRTNGSMMIGYATANRGASHMESPSGPLERKDLPGATFGTDATELGFPPGGFERLGYHGKPSLVMKSQDVGAFINSLSMCYFGFFLYGIRVAHHIDYLNAVTGWDIDFQEAMTNGERAFNLKRLVNLRRGLSAKDDTIPQRFLTRRPGMEGKEMVPESLEKLIQDYYQVRGWTKEGVPSASKREQLGLPASM